jgi:hypothetical protein
MTKNRGDIVEMRVLVQGAIRVNCACVERDYGDCLLLYVDLHSKYAKVDCVGSSDESGPVVYISADENTIHLDDSKPRNLATEIEFHELKGWRVFGTDGPGRYTLAVTLVAP